MPKRFVTAIIILILTFVALFFNFKGEPEIVSPLGSQSEKSITSKIKNILEPKSDLETMIENYLKDKEGTFAVYVEDLSTGEVSAVNQDRKFLTASLYKLWVMGEAFNQIKSGKLKEDESLSVEKGVLYEKFELDVAQENKKDQIGNTVKSAIENMIIISDNDSALLLVNRLGHDNIAKLLMDYGLLESRFENPPESSAKDIAQFFEKLYRGEIVDPQYSGKMLDILKRQRLNDRIPKFLPAQVAVAHKTGELDDMKHDAGIVFAQNPYVLVVLSQTPTPAEAAAVTADLSREIYEFRLRAKR